MCFIFGTKIYTPDGQRPVEELSDPEGLVWTYHAETKERETSRYTVSHLGKWGTPFACIVHKLGKTVMPVGVPVFTRRGWIPAGLLMPNDSLLLATGYRSDVQTIGWDKNSYGQPVLVMTVLGENKNLFADDILVAV